MARTKRTPAQIVMLPPPVGGLNARDAITGMPAQDALTLDNWFPENSYARLRRGYTSWATGFAAPVQTVMEYAGASRKMFAASGNSIYDVSSLGAIGAAALSGLTNAKWQHTQFSNSGGTYLVMVNGADGVLTYNGTTWATQSITGATAANFFQVASWKNRLWFAEAGTSKAWYLATDAIAGSATSLELGGVWRRGGTLQRIIASSFDTAGTELSDYIIFVSSNGELAVYRGTDPASPSTFSLDGVFQIGSPVGNRCTYQTGGDVAMITNDGVVSLLQMMAIDRSASPRASATDKITRLFNDDWRLYSSLFGWQVISYPAAHMAIVNVPTSSTTFKQYAMNTVTGAWCRFTGINSYCWAIYNDRIYFGAEDTLYRFDDGNADDGAAIQGVIRPAFNGCGRPNLKKRFTMAKPLFQSSVDPQATLQVDVDYEQNSVSANYTVSVTDSAWDVALWDVDVWGGNSLIIDDWAAVSARVGNMVSVGIVTSLLGAEIQLNGIGLVYEPSETLSL